MPGCTIRQKVSRPDLVGNSDLQHRGDDQLRRLVRGRRDHGIAARRDADPNIVAALDELGHKALAETVMSRG
jgi:hypothetical protein